MLDFTAAFLLLQSIEKEIERQNGRVSGKWSLFSDY